MVIIIVVVMLSSSVLYTFYRQPNISVNEGNSTITFEAVRNISAAYPAIVTNTSVSEITQSNAPVSKFQLTLNDSISTVLSGDSIGGNLIIMNLSFAGSILDNLHPSSVTLGFVNTGTGTNYSNSSGQLIGIQQKNVNTTTLFPGLLVYSFTANNSRSFTLNLTNRPILLQFEHSRSSYYNFSCSGLFDLYYFGGTPSTLYFNVTATLNGLSLPVSATVDTVTKVS